MKRQRSRRCRLCGKQFYPDIRQKDRQRYCSKEFCQKTRHNRNVREWYLKNPDCLRYQRAQTRRWAKEHPGYQKSYWKAHPQSLLQNRQTTKIRMRQLRGKKVFEKMNSSFLELIKHKQDKCYLNARSGWVHMRLKKQTRYTRYLRVCQDIAQRRPKRVRPLSGMVYDLADVVAYKTSPP